MLRWSSFAMISLVSKSFSPGLGRSSGVSTGVKGVSWPDSLPLNVEPVEDIDPVVEIELALDANKFDLEIGVMAGRPLSLTGISTVVAIFNE